MLLTDDQTFWQFNLISVFRSFFFTLKTSNMHNSLKTRPSNDRCLIKQATADLASWQSQKTSFFAIELIVLTFTLFWIWAQLLYQLPSFVTKSISCSTLLDYSTLKLHGDPIAVWRFVTFAVLHSCLPFCTLEGLTTNWTWWYSDKFNTHSLTYSLTRRYFSM